MKKLSKLVLTATTVSIFLSACNAGVSPTSNLMPVNNDIQIDQEFSSFSSQVSNELLSESDRNRDNRLTRAEVGLSEFEMQAMDRDRDGNISKKEISDSLYTELKNALAASRQIESMRKNIIPAQKQISAASVPDKPMRSMLKTNNVQLYIDREEILPMVFNTIDSAKESIQMDLFLLGGNIGLQVAQKLVNKRNEGVDIKITFDPNLGFAGATQAEVYKVVSFLEKNGIKFKLYPLHLMPIVQDGFLKNKFQIDHNKMIVVDKSTFIIGGYNMFDIGVINRDLMLKIQGPTAEEASKMLSYEWSLADNFVSPKAPKDVYVVKSASQSQVRIVSTGLLESTTKQAMIDAINSASESVYLAILEFSDLDITKALINAHKRGVDVRVIMDRKNTNDKYAGGVPVPNYFPNILPARDLVKNNVPTRWYNPKVDGQELHMKMVVIDGSHLITGSTNFTKQAFTTFRETSVEVIGGSTPQKMVKTFMEDWMNNSSAVKTITLRDKMKAKVIEYMDRKYIGWW